MKTNIFFYIVGLIISRKFYGHFYIILSSVLQVLRTQKYCKIQIVGYTEIIISKEGVSR